jgi:hypothetical protein
MKTPAAVFLVLLFPLALFGQSNVDRLVAQLESATKGTLQGWKYSTNFSGDPTKAGFDDS